MYAEMIYNEIHDGDMMVIWWNGKTNNEPVLAKDVIWRDNYNVSNSSSNPGDSWGRKWPAGLLDTCEHQAPLVLSLGCFRQLIVSDSIC